MGVLSWPGSLYYNLIFVHFTSFYPCLTPPFPFHLSREPVITILGILEAEPVGWALVAVATLAQWKMDNAKVPAMGVINALGLPGDN